ncbi:MAG: FHA domain-containing protein [Chloroflexus sp.]|uniref:FHA domain-containing protein n=1 Tax=Chloroflexus sp. TaxID=1904827 RepID=UPI0030A85743
MIICPSCGAQNDPTNRFCDQCGRRLAEPTSSSVPLMVSPDQPTALAPSCPACGATVLPGERFCSICGADLMTTPPVPAAGNDQATLIAPPAGPAATDAPTVIAPPPAANEPTIIAPPPAAPAGPPAADAPTVIAPPPTANEPTIIAPPPAAPAEPSAADAPTVFAPSPTANEPPIIAPPPAAPAEPAAADAPTVFAPSPVVEGPTIVELPSAADAEPPVTETPAVVTPLPDAPAEPPHPPVAQTSSAPVVADISAERARLEALLAAHRETVAQYEQMAARYPAGSVPAFILAGLDAARAELAKTEADLAALPSGPDPAEVARLEGLLTAHRETVAQYEQMAARYPAGSVPAFILAGLDAARAELAKTEAELAALLGHAPAPAPAAVAHPAAPTPIGTPVSILPAPEACLVLADGSEITLAPGRSEYIIGREDPVSNIFPEVDLTPYGGELGGVSRQHAKIVHIGNQWSIVDLNSTNHTRVNGQRIEPQTPTPISDGTKLQFGRLVATFHVKS